MRKNKPGSDSSPAQATVIIPAHNEASVIDRCLGSIYNSIKPGEFEVIVVCNGCTDDTAKVVATRFPLVKLLETPIASKVDRVTAGGRAGLARSFGLIPFGSLSHHSRR